MARKKVEKLNNKNSNFTSFESNIIEPEAERRVIAIAEIVKMLVEVIVMCIDLIDRISMKRRKLTLPVLFPKQQENTVCLQLQKYTYNC